MLPFEFEEGFEGGGRRAEFRVVVAGGVDECACDGDSGVSWCLYGGRRRGGKRDRQYLRVIQHHSVSFQLLCSLRAYSVLLAASVEPFGRSLLLLHVCWVCRVRGGKWRNIVSRRKGRVGRIGREGVGGDATLRAEAMGWGDLEMVVKLVVDFFLVMVSVIFVRAR